MNHRSVWRRWVLLLLFPLFTAAAQAQSDEWPSRTIKIVSPFPPGGTTDLLARLFAPPLSRALGQSVIVENRAGCGGSIGTGVVAKSPPDGYTFVLVFDTHAVNPSLLPNLPFDTRADLVKPGQQVANIAGINGLLPIEKIQRLPEFLLRRNAV